VTEFNFDESITGTKDDVGFFITHSSFYAASLPEYLATAVPRLPFIPCSFAASSYVQFTNFTIVLIFGIIFAVA
jgi:hypothetical protein